MSFDRFRSLLGRTRAQLGPGGPFWRQVGAFIEARTPDETAFTNIRAADPLIDDDLVTKRFGDANYGGAADRTKYHDFSAQANGILVAFVIAPAIADSTTVQVGVRGQLQRLGVDYVITNPGIITFTIAPFTGDDVLIWYVE